TAEIGSSALFASRFRECAARAMLLPRRQPGRRSPLWQQRQRAAQLLEVASHYPSFPIVLETVRECLQDVFDVPALVSLLRDLAGRKIRIVEVETQSPSPFSRSLLFRYVGAFMYEGDAPLAERRAQALTLDSALLADLLGQADLRELLDPAVVGQTEQELQRLAEDRKARDVEGLADVLRAAGPLSAGEVAERCTDPAAAAGWLAELAHTRRAIEVRVGGQPRWAAIEDASRLRDALGVPLPPGVPEAFTEPLPDPLGDLVARYARTHGPFTADAAAARYALGVAVVAGTLRRLAAAGRVAEGEFLPGGRGTEWCDSEVLRMLRRRCLARLRKEAEPAPPVALARLLPAWQGVRAIEPAGQGRGSRRRSRGASGPGAVLDVLDQLAGAPVAASALETLVLPGRIRDYSPTMLDELTAAGEVLWTGAGGLPGGDGWLVLASAESAPLLFPEPAEITMTPVHQALLDALGDGGAVFFRMLHERVSARLAGDPSMTKAPPDADVAAAIWDLTWAGLLTNDTLGPLRTVLGSGGPRRAAPPASRSRSPRYGRRPSYGRPAMPSRTGPPNVSGRWSLLPPGSTDATLRAHALAQSLLDRYGILTKGAVAAERITGGFSAVYPVLRAMEDAGRARRGYFVEGLGAAQFAIPGAVDRMRALAQPPGGPGGPLATALSGGAVPYRGQASGGDGAFTDLWVYERDGDPVPPEEPEEDQQPGQVIVLSAPDPANAYGASLPWPERPDETPGGHRPGRKAGALVILADGELVLYVERGGRTLLSWTDDLDVLRPVAGALADAVRAGALGRLTVERADGDGIYDSPLATALEEAGFRPTPRGLRLRG
ncbi:MAG TPA: DEAD/DEAH box helicase, partial [Streptosporangiaceae bacterium]|nr:DEAD/DEAH box helicase [Streptosporangiaceae bacterium]